MDLLKPTMKIRILLLIIEIKGIIREYYEQYYINRLDNQMKWTNL